MKKWDMTQCKNKQKTFYQSPCWRLQEKTLINTPSGSFLHENKAGAGSLCWFSNGIKASHVNTRHVTWSSHCVSSHQPERGLEISSCVTGSQTELRWGPGDETLLDWGTEVAAAPAPSYWCEWWSAARRIAGLREQMILSTYRHTHIFCQENTPSFTFHFSSSASHVTFTVNNIIIHWIMSLFDLENCCHLCFCTVQKSGDGTFLKNVFERSLFCSRDNLFDQKYSKREKNWEILLEFKIAVFYVNICNLFLWCAAVFSASLL